MSFKATLDIDGNQYRVLNCNYSFGRSVDQFGKPSSDVMGGQIDLSIESNGETGFLEWITSSYTRKNGKVVFNKTNEDAELKVLEFEDAYLVNYSETFDSEPNSSGMTEHLTISAKKIIMGGAEHENAWPS